MHVTLLRFPYLSFDAYPQLSYVLHPLYSLPLLVVVGTLFPVISCLMLSWAFRERKPLSMGSLLMERIFRSTPNGVLWHIMSGCQVCDWGIQYHLCSTCRGLWELVVIRLLWLSGRALAAQARGVLGSTPSDCRPFHFPLVRLITSKSIYFQCEARWSEHVINCIVI